MCNASRIPGSKIVEVDGKPALAIGSCRLIQEDIKAISEIPDLTGVLFYTTRLENVDLSILSNASLKKLIFMQGNIGDNELRQMEKIKSLELLKIMGTNVSREGLVRFRNEMPHVELKYTP